MNKNNKRNNIVVSQDGYTIRKNNSTIKHYTKTMSGNRDGYEFTSFSSTTIINYDDDFSLDFENNYDEDFIETTCDEINDYEQLPFSHKLVHKKRK